VLRVVAAYDASRCVVVTRVQGSSLKKASKGEARFELEPMTHHERRRPMMGCWVSVGPPAGVRSLGVVPLRAHEGERVLHPEPWVKATLKTAVLAAKVLPLASCDVVMADARAQFRWVHEREAVLAEDARAEHQRLDQFSAALAAQGKETEALARRGVTALKARRFFGAWKGQLPRALISDAELALRETVLSLEGRTAKQAARALTKLVRTFNRLGPAHGHTFDSTEAEDIMDAVGTVALACGVDEATFDTAIDAARKF
jgi:hypothetical protein